MDNGKIGGESPRHFRWKLTNDYDLWRPVYQLVETKPEYVLPWTALPMNPHGLELYEGPRSI